VVEYDKVRLVIQVCRSIKFLDLELGEYLSAIDEKPKIGLRSNRWLLGIGDKRLQGWRVDFIKDRTV
jgi:hypothetical protein